LARQFSFTNLMVSSSPPAHPIGNANELQAFVSSVLGLQITSK